MKEYSLTLAEVLALDIELNGQIDQTTGVQRFKGLLNQSLPLVAKYWLTKLSKTVADEKAKVEAIRQDLVKKYGETDEQGNVSLKIYLDEEQTQVNPIFVEYSKEYGTLLNESVTIQYSPIKLSSISNIETTETYGVFYNFVDEAQ